MYKLFKVVIIALFCFSLGYICQANADEDVAPEYLKDAVITVTLKNGKEYKFSANTHKVVARGTSKPTKVIIVDNTIPTPVTKHESKKNRVSLLAGSGPRAGVDINQSVSRYEVSNENAFLGGAMYQREVKGDISVGVGALTNKTVILGVGLDF